MHTLPVITSAARFHPLVLRYLIANAAWHLFTRLFWRYSRMLMSGDQRLQPAWERRILRALDSVNGTGLVYEWDAGTGHWQIWEPAEDEE